MAGKRKARSKKLNAQLFERNNYEIEDDKKSWEKKPESKKTMVTKNSNQVI